MTCNSRKLTVILIHVLNLLTYKFFKRIDHLKKTEISMKSFQIHKPTIKLHILIDDVLTLNKLSQWCHFVL